MAAWFLSFALFAPQAVAESKLALIPPDALESRRHGTFYFSRDVRIGRLDRFRTDPAIPLSHSAEVWIDFDGTLTTCDVVDSLVRRFSVNDSWRRIEADWEAGRIGSRACLAGQFALIRITDDELDGFLDAVSLDPGAADLLALLDRHGVPATVVSDGIDWFISRVFAAHGLRPPAVRSNSAVRDGLSLRLTCPFSSAPMLGCGKRIASAARSELWRTASSEPRVSSAMGVATCAAPRTADLRFAKGSFGDAA